LGSFCEFALIDIDTHRQIPMARRYCGETIFIIYWQDLQELPDSAGGKHSAGVIRALPGRGGDLEAGVID